MCPPHSPCGLVFCSTCLSQCVYLHAACFLPCSVFFLYFSWPYPITSSIRRGDVKGVACEATGNLNWIWIPFMPKFSSSFCSETHLCCFSFLSYVHTIILSCTWMILLLPGLYWTLDPWPLQSVCPWASFSLETAGNYSGVAVIMSETSAHMQQKFLCVMCVSRLPHPSVFFFPFSTAAPQTIWARQSWRSCRHSGWWVWRLASIHVGDCSSSLVKELFFALFFSNVTRVYLQNRNFH